MQIHGDGRADALVDRGAVRRCAGASGAVQWADGAVPAVGWGKPVDSEARAALYRAAGRLGLFHLADVFARAERAVPAQPGAIGAGAAVSGTGIGDKTEDTPNYEAQPMGYAYPWVSGRVLRGILPHAQALAPFTYGFTETGELVRPDDEQMRALAKDFSVTTLLHFPRSPSRAASLPRAQARCWKTKRRARL